MRELIPLKAFAEALNREVDLSRTLVTGLRFATDLFELETGWIWPLDEHTRAPYLAAIDGLLTGLHEPQATPLAMLTALAGQRHIHLT